MTITNDVYCLAYLAGFTATSNDNYQANITCSIFTANSLKIDVTVHSDTKISALNLYLLLFDRTHLAIASLYFV